MSETSINKLNKNIQNNIKERKMTDLNRLNVGINKSVNKVREGSNNVKYGLNKSLKKR